MFRYEVGKLYNTNRTSWPETPQFNFRDNTFELLLFYNRPTIGEIVGVQSGQAEFALVISGDIIFFMSRFGDKGIWSDAPYTYHMVPVEQQTPLPDLRQPEEGILLNVLLVDAATGVIKAIRAVSLSPHFSRKLVEAINTQQAQPFDQTRYDAQLAQMYKRYPDSKLMLKLASARSAGGV